MALEPTPKRDYQARELRLLSEWVATRPAGEKVLMRVRLGAIKPELKLEGLTGSDLKMLGLFRRWADALIVTRTSKTIVEAKIVAHPVAISQLAIYARLINDTPELAEFRDLETRKLILCAVEDPVVTAEARAQGIDVTVYTPAWLNEYFTLLRARERRPPR